MTYLNVTIGKHKFKAEMEEIDAPTTCAQFKELLPYSNKVIHVRWSGEAVWIPLEEDFPVNLEYENHTSHPSKGEILFYPGNISQPEIIIPYGSTSFSSKVGQLAGNHFLTIVNGLKKLSQLGEKILWGGAEDIKLEEYN